MSYDDWLTEPPPIESAEDAPCCVICGLQTSQLLDNRYCGEACARADEEGMSGAPREEK